MLLFLFLAGTLQAQEEIEDNVRYKKRVEKYISRWEKLIPHYINPAKRKATPIKNEKRFSEQKRKAMKIIKAILEIVSPLLLH